MNFVAFQIVSLSNIQCDVFELKEDNYKIWKERIFLQFGWMDIDYAIRKDESLAITDESSQPLLRYMSGESDPTGST